MKGDNNVKGEINVIYIPICINAWARRYSVIFKMRQLFDIRSVAMVMMLMVLHRGCWCRYYLHSSVCLVLQHEGVRKTTFLFHLFLLSLRRDLALVARGTSQMKKLYCSSRGQKLAVQMFWEKIKYGINLVSRANLTWISMGLTVQVTLELPIFFLHEIARGSSRNAEVVVKKIREVKKIWMKIYFFGEYR